MAIWGLESDFGRGDIGKMPVIRTLATLAHDCRRTELFQGELIAALQIVQRGDLPLRDLIGAFAGEIGQTQFLPSSYIKYGVDFDGNGHVDLRHSVPDVLASTANLLRTAGWKAARLTAKAARISRRCASGTGPPSTARPSAISPTGWRGGERLSMSLAFLVTSLIVIVSPGTGVLYTLAAALTRGSRASLAAAFGCTLGIVPHIAAATLGLAAVLHASALAFAALKWLGVIYLLYMAWQALRQRGALKVDGRVDARSALKVIVTGFLINILNPKLSMFFLAFLPQYIAADEGRPVMRMLAAQRRVHGDDLRGVCGLRPVRGSRARPHRHPAEGDDLAAPGVCRRLCRAGGQAGAGGTVIPVSCRRGFLPKSKRRTRGPPPPFLPTTVGPRRSAKLRPSLPNYFFLAFFAFLAFFVAFFFAFLAIASSFGLMDGNATPRPARGG